MGPFNSSRKARSGKADALAIGIAIIGIVVNSTVFTGFVGIVVVGVISVGFTMAGLAAGARHDAIGIVITTMQGICVNDFAAAIGCSTFVGIPAISIFAALVSGSNISGAVDDAIVILGGIAIVVLGDIGLSTTGGNRRSGISVGAAAAATAPVSFVWFVWLVTCVVVWFVWIVICVVVWFVWIVNCGLCIVCVFRII